MKRFLFFVMVTVASGPALADEAVLNGSRMYYEDRGRGEPVVLLHGIQAGETAARDITGARKVAYPAAGHMINMEEPRRFNRDLEAFLASLPR